MSSESVNTDKLVADLKVLVAESEELLRAGERRDLAGEIEADAA